MKPVSRILMVCLALSLGYGCGRAVDDYSSVKIIGGRPVASDQPSFVQIIDGSNAPQGYCGGSLIRHRVVLTAAHCVEPQYIKSMYVVLGMADGRNLHLKKPVKVEGVVVHPGYQPEGDDPGQNDIALLYLASYQDDQFERPTAPINLHEGEASIESLTSTVRVVGLGNTSSLGWLSDGVIREVDLPVLELAQCARKYRNIGSSQICAGEITSGGIDSCQGDSGGPLMFKDSHGNWTLAGIVSYGEGCAQKGSPGVYTRVSSFVPWIKQSIEKLTKPVPDQLSEPAVTNLLKTRCLSQFDYIPRRFDAGENTRQTVYGINRETLSLAVSRSAPRGVVLEKCSFLAGRHNIAASWILVKNWQNSRRDVLIVSASSNGKIWNSPPQDLDYRQDRLTCQTSQGPVVLLDQYKTTSIQFKDVIYQLDTVIDAPGDNEITWGCSVGDASIEIFEDARGGEKRLSARVFHQRVGAVVATLKKMDQDAEVDASITWEVNGKGLLKFNNNSATDIFTWRLVCPVPFSVKMGGHAEVLATAIDDGVGYGLVFDSALISEGTIRSGQSREFKIRREDGSGEALSGCMINDTVPVLQVN